MQYSLKYGHGDLPIRVPVEADVTLVRKPSMPVLPDASLAVAEALDHPIGCEPLTRLTADAKSAAIAICDITRPVPNHLFLRPVIRRLIDGGIAREDITVIVATGLHRPNEGDELAELIGDPWVLQNVRVVNHFARRDDEHVSLGVTKTRGTVVRLDKRFVDADLRIATGLVEPHFMAGYSGGRKVIAPGLAHAETITTFHSARFMADPATANCNFAGNPLHEEQLQIVEMLGGALAINTVINEHRQVSLVNFGEIVASHDEAVRFARDYCEVDLPKHYGTVVTSAAGYPLDKTYYQTVKGMVGAMNILAPGGNLIIASECSEGMGSPEFVESQRRLSTSDPQSFLSGLLKKSHADIDEWQTQMQLAPMAIGDVSLFSTGLDVADHPLTCVRVIPGDPSALDRAIAASIASQNDPSLAIIPEGPYVVPFHRPRQPA